MDAATAILATPESYCDRAPPLPGAGESAPEIQPALGALPLSAGLARVPVTFFFRKYGEQRDASFVRAGEALLIKFPPPATLARLGGAEKMAEAIDACLTLLGETLKDPEDVRALILEGPR